MTSNHNFSPSEQMDAGLLISVRSIEEAQMAIRSGVLWLDLKEPLLGSLGRPSMKIIGELASFQIPKAVQVSVAGGELSEWDRGLEAELAAMLPSHFYLKLALANCKDIRWDQTAARISEMLSRPSQLILVYYADAANARSPQWEQVCQCAVSIGSDYVLIDTYKKSAGGLLDHCTIEELREMIRWAKELPLGVALAGSLRLDQLESLSRVGAKWLGVRGAVCTDSQRTSSMCQKRLKHALSLFPNYSRNEA